jgi:hypothetical protein
MTKTPSSTMYVEGDHQKMYLKCIVFETQPVLLSLNKGQAVIKSKTLKNLVMLNIFHKMTLVKWKHITLNSLPLNILEIMFKTLRLAYILMLMKNKLAIEYSLNLRLFALKKISLYIEKKF